MRRREAKLILGRRAATALETELRARLAFDAHAGPDGTYRVASRYYDTPELAVYATQGAEKLRLRTYGLTRGPRMPAVVELKSKLDGVSHKQRLMLPLRDATALLEGVWPDRPTSDAVLAMRIVQMVRRAPMLPACDVIYDRTALVGTREGLRVTFDRNIRVAAASASAHRTWFPVIGGERVVVEVKVEGEDPPWLAGMFGMQTESFSKYREAMAALIGGEAAA